MTGHGPCQTCHAEAGDACRTVSGRPNSTHYGRPYLSPATTAAVIRPATTSDPAQAWARVLDWCLNRKVGE